MKSRMYRTLIAAVGAVTLLCAANTTFAASRAGSHGVSTHRSSHRLAAHFFRHHHRTQAAVFADDGFFSGPTGQPIFEGGQAIPGASSTNTNNIPWDWAHRYPPIVGPSQRPYISGCDAEIVTVPDGRGGSGQVNVTRCY